ncbi:SANT/Myb_domain [Hexamita inflata]|uniref:SANT/Myb domain n=1 Tax=Hexamita inflata TaxID=28002 RepID=A0AA86NY29_9EUKA|nr:SANT/Myb domain [Hexamita inflata]
MINKLIDNALIIMQIQDINIQINSIIQQIAEQGNAINKQTREHWNLQQDNILLQLVSKFGFRNCEDIAKEMKCRTEKQVYFRLRYIQEQYTRESNKLSTEWRLYLAQQYK